METLMLTILIACGSSTTSRAQTCKLEMIKCFNETEKHTHTYKAMSMICLMKKLRPVDKDGANE